MYCIIREGKSYWAIKQIIHIVAMSFVFIVMAAVTSIMPILNKRRHQIINGEK